MSDHSTISCPACSAPADLRSFDGLYGRAVSIDLCHACGGLWLDGLEALQLSPGGVLALLREMDDPQRGSRQPATVVPRCPRCRARLVPTEDRQRNTRFTYDRCPNRHGRFMTFFQFLRSRNFVRELTPEELRTLRDQVQSVNCSNCGAPVDVARAATCSHCRTPISTVEPGQLRKAIEDAQRAKAKRQAGDPSLPLRLLAERAAVERAFGEADPGMRGGAAAGTGGPLADTVLRLVGRIFQE